ncbi:ABC transporter substrate-binding protein [Tomitella biformata]|uniref:ABC transporter substrate-binding protein n=1 Tax=Tomitella biformata TaxID=630403 RepID=UPI00190837DC|nr:ABC transporter substrate-binding protein [Tomitella biformata]
MKVELTVQRQGRGRSALRGVAATAASCAGSDSGDSAFGYVVDGAVPTYNANTLAGSSSAARQAFARTLGGFSLAGPQGNVVADHDFGEASVVPGDRLVVDYQINPAATYSDGQPVVCDDLVLAWAAGSGTFTKADDSAAGGRSPLFDSATVPGMADIESIDCAAGAKAAEVTFRPGRAVTDWRALFGATTVLPAHVVSAGAGGLDIVGAVQDRDEAALAAVAEFWNTGFTLSPGTADPAVFVSSGPYRLDSVGEDGSVQLTANEKWWGDAPRTGQITIWPRDAELGQLIADGRVQVLDIREGSGAVDGLEIASAESNGIEQLTLSTRGALEPAAARRALALCVPREKWAPPSDSRLALPDTLAYPFVSGAAAGRYQHSDAEAAGAELANAGLAGLTVRIGYASPDPQRAGVVADIASSCADAGITVIDESAPGLDPAALRDGRIDALLGGAGGVQSAGGALSDDTRTTVLRGDASSNVGGFHNPRFDEIADQLSVTTRVADTLNLTREAEDIAWDGLPSLPLYTQTRTVAFAEGLHSGLPSASSFGAGWNMDRWIILR